MSSKYDVKSYSCFAAGAVAFGLGVSWAFAPSSLASSLSFAGVPAAVWAADSPARHVGAALGVALGVALMHASVLTRKAAVTVVCAGSSALLAGAADALTGRRAYPAANLGALLALLVAAATYEYYFTGAAPAAKGAAPAARVTRSAAKAA